MTQLNFITLFLIFFNTKEYRSFYQILTLYETFYTFSSKRK